MTQQSKALRLADALERDPSEWGGLNKVAWPAAAELRRLERINAQLLEALEYHQEQTRPIQKTTDAIAAARSNK
jgi:hypothetical protein